jgi:hypothetical protein
MPNNAPAETPTKTTTLIAIEPMSIHSGRFLADPNYLKSLRALGLLDIELQYSRVRTSKSVTDTHAHTDICNIRFSRPQQN